MNRIITNPRVRRWLYGIALAATALLAVYGLLDGEQVAAWNAVAAALFGLALVNTPDKDDTDHD